jgi:hypothetical protein
MLYFCNNAGFFAKTRDFLLGGAGRRRYSPLRLDSRIARLFVFLSLAWRRGGLF